MKKNILLAGAIVVYIIMALVGIIVAFYAFNHFIYQQKQAGDEIVSYRGTLSGEYVCLPHITTTGAQTDECASGIKTDVGEYYAIDLSLMSQEHQPLEVGDRISANGVITPIELLSTDHWNQYPIEGIFSVTDSLVVL